MEKRGDDDGTAAARSMMSFTDMVVAVAAADILTLCGVGVGGGGGVSLY